MMKKRILKNCIICNKEFVKYPLVRESGKKAMLSRSDKIQTRPIFSFTCSKECSKKMMRFIEHLKKRQNLLKHNGLLRRDQEQLISTRRSVKLEDWSKYQKWLKKK